jgi:heat shock protein HtpX
MMPVPKIGIIEDGNPNAFTFGHIQKNARIVVTAGLLEVLSEEEQKAVIAHELGHIKHNDFIMMMVVSIIPMIMYQIYVWCSKGKKDTSASYCVGLGAYVVYILSQYLVLSFSRIREYYADRFSKELTADEEALKRALIKIAYGFTTLEKKKKVPVSTIGISNAAQNEGFMLANYYQNQNGIRIEEKLLQWDQKSFWGKWYELNSTHPLTAKRIMALSNQPMNITRIGWTEILKFIWEAFISLLPWVTAVGLVIFNWQALTTKRFLFVIFQVVREHPLLLVVLGAAILLKYYYSYLPRGFQSHTISELLEREDASPVRGIPAVIEGKVIGRGIPGLFYSEDLTVDDGTGIILVDYRQPLRILELIFGLEKVEGLIDQPVKVVGWYKRSVRPYFVCLYIEREKHRSYSYTFFVTRIFGYLLLVAGVLFSILR